MKYITRIPKGLRQDGSRRACNNSLAVKDLKIKKLINKRILIKKIILTLRNYFCWQNFAFDQLPFVNCKLIHVIWLNFQLLFVAFDE